MLDTGLKAVETRQFHCRVELEYEWKYLNWIGWWFERIYNDLMVATSLLNIFHIFNLNSLKPCIKLHTFTKNDLFYKATQKNLLPLREHAKQTKWTKSLPEKREPITRLHNYPFYRGRVPWLGHFGAFFSPHVPFPCGDNCPRYTHTHPHTDHQVGHDRRRNKRAASGRTLHYRRLVVPLTDSIFPPFDDVQRKWSNLWALFFVGLLPIMSSVEICGETMFKK